MMISFRIYKSKHACKEVAESYRQGIQIQSSYAFFQHFHQAPNLAKLGLLWPKKWKKDSDQVSSRNT